MTLKQRITSLFRKNSGQEPAKAYDTWAASYDDQPGNLMLDLDEELMDIFLDETDPAGKMIVDVGCGTGRHWAKWMARNPAQLTGYDVSRGMLEKLNQKFPAAVTRLLEGNKLEGLEPATADLLISTLTVAHIEHIADAFQEWDRVLKPGATIYITDFHPELLTRGGQRTFHHEGRTVAVRNYIHPLNRLRELFRQLGWTEIRFSERTIDEPVKKYYEARQALDLFEKYKGMPVIYSFRLKKDHGSS